MTDYAPMYIPMASSLYLFKCCCKRLTSRYNIISLPSYSKNTTHKLHQQMQNQTKWFPCGTLASLVPQKSNKIWCGNNITIIPTSFLFPFVRLRTILHRCLSARLSAPCKQGDINLIKLSIFNLGLGIT